MQENMKTGSTTQPKPRGKITGTAGRRTQTNTRPGAKKSASKGGRGTTKKTVKAIISGTQRHQLISEAAYFKAEQRGFEGDDAIRDWLEAEAHIDSMYQTEA